MKTAQAFPLEAWAGDSRWRCGLLMFVLFVALPLLVGAIEGCAVEDHSGERERAAQMEAQLRRVEAQARLEEAAQAACGTNAAYKLLSPKRAQCFDKHGRKTVVVELLP